MSFALAIAVGTVARYLRRKKPRDPSDHNLLMIDTSYDFSELEGRGSLALIKSKDVGGFFKHVYWTAPLVGASPAHRRSAYGRPRHIKVTPAHTAIEGHTAWSPRATLPLLSFARAQAALLSDLDRKIAADGVNVIQASDPYYPGLLALLLSRRYGTAFAIRISANYEAIYDATGRIAYPRLLRSRRLEERIARFVLKRADLVLPANENNRDFATGHGAVDDRCILIPAYGDVLDPLHLSPPQDRARPTDVPGGDFVLVISRLEPVKHPEDAIEALARLSTGERVSLVIAGEGSLRSDLEALARRLDVAAEVHLVGDRSQEWIAGAAAHASVVLSPLTGRALVEALLGGRPVVAYDVEWQGEIIDHGRSGILIPYRDITGTAKALDRLLTDRSLATEIGKRGRETALGLVSPEVIRPKQQQAYLQAIDRARARRSA